MAYLQAKPFEVQKNKITSGLKHLSTAQVYRIPHRPLITHMRTAYKVAVRMLKYYEYLTKKRHSP